MSRWPNPLETSHLLVIKKTPSNIELYFPQCNLEKLAFFLFLKTYLCLKSKIHYQGTLLDFLCTALTAKRYSNAWLYWLIDWFIDLLIYWLIGCRFGSDGTELDPEHERPRVRGCRVQQDHCQGRPVPAEWGKGGFINYWLNTQVPCVSWIGYPSNLCIVGWCWLKKCTLKEPFSWLQLYFKKIWKFFIFSNCVSN